MYSKQLLVLTFLVVYNNAYAQYFVPIPEHFDFPFNFSTSQSEQCRHDIQIFLQHLSINSLWAYRMWDASSKIAPSLTEGSPYQLGNYDECLSISEPFDTQYCLSTISFKLNTSNIVIEDPFSLAYTPYKSVYQKLYYTNDPNRIHRDRVYWALCIPKTCNSNDVQIALQNFLDKEQNTNLNYEIQLNNIDCETANAGKSFNAADYIFCIVVIILALFVIICTFYDMYYIEGDQNLERKKDIKLLMCFSAKRSFNELGKADSSNQSLHILYGIRVFLTYAIVFGHSIINTLLGPISNFEDVEQVNRSVMMMQECRGDVTVDTFFLISGLLGTYTYLIQSEKKNINPLRSIILRYFRLIPVFALMTFFYATILYKLGSGPLWHKIVGSEQHYCQKNWWTNIILLNNYIDIDNMCLIQGWYNGAEFQLFLLSIPLNYLIKQRNKLCWTIFTGVFIVSMVLPFTLIYLDNQDPVFYIFNDFFFTLRNNRFFQRIYVPFHTRATTYILGMVFGYVYYQIKDSKINISALPTAVLFIMSMVAAVACIFSGAVFYNPYIPYKVLNGAFYAVFHRTAFALATGIAIFVTGYGTIPFLTKFLSWKPFIPLAKLTFNVYLVHMMFEFIKPATQRSSEPITGFIWISDATLTLVYSNFIAFFLFIIVENPFIKFTKELLATNSAKTGVTNRNAESTA